MNAADPGIDALGRAVRAWIEADPDPETRAEAADLLAAAEAGDPEAEARLHDAFDSRLAFGTAGLRARLGAGPHRMNRVVVAQSSSGLAAYLLERAARGETADPPTAVVGYDARVMSDVFARDTAEVLAGAGVRVTLFPAPVPTPVTAFAVRHLGASAGVMITASHNPPSDNGYKVYLGDADGGSQIVPPSDREIAERIETAAQRPLAELPRSVDYRLAGPEIERAYVERTAAAVRAGCRADTDQPAIEVVYTALHGVGAGPARRVLEAAGLPGVIAVPEQEQPDGAFPTLAYPNPEEPSALDLAYRLAEERGAQLVIANDPDADRLGVAALHPEERAFRLLSGNEIGLLLGWRAAERARAAGRGGTLANTVVSSPALGAVARRYGLEHVETLSGSKWLARIPGLIFGFEEALGYLVHPGVVGDKDGIAAAAEMLALARECRAEGRTLWDLLDEASLAFGRFASRQIVLRYPRTEEARAVSERARAHAPAAFGRRGVARVRDFRVPGLAAVTANVLAYDLDDGSRVMIRPSGTEPKLKIYIDACSDTGSIADRRAETDRALDGIEAAAREYLEELGS